MVQRITRALTNGAYRRRNVPLDRESVENDDTDDDAMQTAEARAKTRLYFEVLIVDDVTDSQARSTKQNMAAMRRGEDAFNYEPVVVSSLEDALIGALFNHNVQAIVVRPGLALKSKVDLPVLHATSTAPVPKKLTGCRQKTMGQSCAV
jgi:arginine decarboxylase